MLVKQPKKSPCVTVLGCNRPIQGYRRHFLKGAKTAEASAGKHTLHRKNKLNIVACCSVFAIFPSFIDFLTLRVFDIIQKILFVHYT